MVVSGDAEYPVTLYCATSCAVLCRLLRSLPKPPSLLGWSSSAGPFSGVPCARICQLRSLRPVSSMAFQQVLQLLWAIAAGRVGAWALIVLVPALENGVDP